MSRLFIVVASVVAAGASVALGQTDARGKFEKKIDYRHVQPVIIEAASAFSDQGPSRVTGMALAREEHDLVVAEGGYGELGVMSAIDLKSRWRHARYEIPRGIASLAPSKNDVVSGTWDDNVRIHDGRSLNPKISIPIDRSAARATVSPDGRTIGVVLEGHEFRDDSPGREVSLYVAETGKLIKKLSTDLFQGLDIQFSPNGRDLAVCGGVYQKPRGGILAWDTVTGEKKIDVTLDAILWKIAYSDDGNWLVGTGVGGTVVVDTQTGKIHKVDPARGGNVVVMPGGKAAVISLGSNLKVYQLPDLELVKTIPSDHGFVTAMMMFESGKKFLTASPTSIHKWDPMDWSHELFIEGRVPVNQGTSLIAIPNSDRMAVATERVLRIVDRQNGKQWNSVTVAANIQEISADSMGNAVGLILGDGNVVVVATATGDIQTNGKIPIPAVSRLSRDLKSVVFTTSDGQVIRRGLVDGAEQAASVKFSSRVVSLAISKIGNVVCGLDSGDVHVFTPDLAQVIAKIPSAANGTIACLDWRDEDRRLVVGSDKLVSVWSVNQQGTARLMNRRSVESKATAVAFSNSGERIAIGLAVGAVAVVSTKGTDAPLRSTPKSAMAIETCVWQEDDREIVTRNSGGLLGRIRLKSKALSPVHQWTAAKGTPIRSACLSPKGDMCFIAVDRKIEVRSTKSWEVVQELSDHRGFVARVRISPDGKWLASTGSDAFVQIRSKTDDVWDIDRTLFLPSFGNRLEWSPDGRWLLVGTLAPEFHVIDTKTWEIVHKLAVPFLVSSFSFSSDSRHVLMSGMLIGDPADLCPLQIWDTTTWTDPKTFFGHRHATQEAMISDDGERFYSTSGDSQLLEYSSSKGLLRRIRHMPSCGTTLSRLPAPNLAIISWHFSNIGVIDLTNGELVASTDGDGAEEKALIQDVTVSGDGQWAISCAQDDLGRGTGSVKLWRIGNIVTSE